MIYSTSYGIENAGVSDPLAAYKYTGPQMNHKT